MQIEYFSENFTFALLNKKEQTDKQTILGHFQRQHVGYFSCSFLNFGRLIASTIQSKLLNFGLLTKSVHWFVEKVSNTLKAASGPSCRFKN